MLIHTSIKDIRTREIDPKYWIIYGAPLMMILALMLYIEPPSRLLLTIYAINVITIISVTLPLFFANMFGGADVFALLVIALSHLTIPLKPNILFPVSLLVLLYTLILILLFPLTFFVFNIYKKNYKKLLNINRAKKIVVLFIGIPLRAEDLINKKFWYPLQRPWTGEFKLSFNIDEDDSLLRSKVSELIRQGKLKPDDIIWSTYGIPTIPFILLGYMLTMLLDDSIIRLLINIP